MGKGTLTLIIIVLLSVGAFGGTFLYKGFKINSEVKKEATAFLEVLSDKDFNTAFGFMSSEFQNYSPEVKEDLLEFLTNFFDKNTFQRQTQTRLRIQSSKYEYHGIAEYTNGFKGVFKIIFVREEDEWKILEFEIFKTYY